MSEYWESDSERVIRLTVQYGPSLCAAFKVGDYVNIMYVDTSHTEDRTGKMFSYANAWDGDEALIDYETINMCNILSHKELKTYNSKTFLSKKTQYDKDNLSKIKRVGRITEIFNGVPIIERIPFNENDDENRSISILECLGDFLDELNDWSDFDLDDPKILHLISNVVSLDDDYADSLLLGTEYVPYYREKATIEGLRTEIKTIQAENRQARLNKEDKKIEREFKHCLGRQLKNLFD